MKEDEGNMKKILLIMVSLTIMLTSIGINTSDMSIKAETAALDTDVKIELIQNDEVVETGINVLTHNRNYVRSSTKTNGDEIVITTPEGVHYLMVQLDQFCGMPNLSGMAKQEQVEGTQKPSDMTSITYGETLVFVMNGELRFVIPGTTGTNAGGTSLGGGNWPYDARAFATTGNREKVITARIPTEEELRERRNLALNPFDTQGNDNGKTSLNKKGDSNLFPHAYANRVTDNKREFEPRNAIDGFEYNASHVGFPYQAWGCGNEKTDSEFSILFGRYVEIDQIDITVRAQWNPPMPNNANDHDINWTSATLEFSDGTEMPITLEKLASPQTIKLTEKKNVSWVRLKDLPVSEEIIPVDGRKKFSALTEFKVWGIEVDQSSISLPSGETLVKLAQKVNDYWIKTGGNTGDDATNYNHGHSVTNEFWAPSVFYTGNMEAYYLTGDENYTDYASRWGNHNIYDGIAWNTKADSGRTGKYYADNHTSFQTYLDMYSTTADTAFDADHEMIKNVVSIMNEMEQMSVQEIKSKGYWDRIDFFYMELPNWTKMYRLTGEDKWLDKLRALYDDRKAELYDEETGLFYRDKNYIYDANATYNSSGDGSNQKISPNGKKILWSRGNGWAMAALTKMLQDLPDNRGDDRAEYEAVFKKMATTLLQEQGEDGFWRMNLNDYDHDTRPETSGTVFFAYGLTWGINHGLLDYDTYYPAVQKAFLGLHANAIRPDGLVGRSELISAYPNPKCSLGIGSSQSYAPAATVLFLSELSKLKEQGYVCDDVEPALRKTMIGNVAVKENSKYAIVNSVPCTLVEERDLTTIKQGDTLYVPKAFVERVYGKATADNIKDNMIEEDVVYVAFDKITEENQYRICSSLDDGISIISDKNELLDPVIDAKLITLLNRGLTDGTYPVRPEYPIRFDYTEPPVAPTPSQDALVSVNSNSAGAVSASRQIGPSSEEIVNVEFDMISVLSPNQTNAIVGIGNAESTYSAYSQVPIIIRMYNDGTFGVYNGTKYVQSNVKFTQNEKYHIRTSIHLEEKTYSVYVTAPNKEEVSIADNFAYRSTAAVLSDIGKIYLFNNDKEAGKYWLEHIITSIPPVQPTPPSDALVSVNASTSGAISASKSFDKHSDKSIEVTFRMVSTLAPNETNAIVGIGNADSNYTAYSQVPIIIRMSTDGMFGVYNGTGYIQSKVPFTQNESYLVRATIDLEAKTYSVYVTAPNKEEVNIVENVKFRSSAKAITDIGKIYLFNNDKAAGAYWLHDISLSSIIDTSELEVALVQAKAINEVNYTEVSYKVLQDAISAAEQVLADTNITQTRIDLALKALLQAQNDLERSDTVLCNVILKNTLEKAAALIDSDTFMKLAPAVQNLLRTRFAESNFVYQNESATVSECMNAWLNLANALHYADFKADKTLLIALVEACTNIDTTPYTQESIAVFEAALIEASIICDDETALQDCIQITYDTLLLAKHGLTKQPADFVNKDILSCLIDLGDETIKQQEKYLLDANWEAFMNALDEAKIVMVDKTADQDQVNHAVYTLSNAYENIRLKPNETMLKELQTFIWNMKAIERTLYAEHDLKAIDDSVISAQGMLDSKNFDHATYQAFMIIMKQMEDIVDNNQLTNMVNSPQKSNSGDVELKSTSIPKTADTSGLTRFAFANVLAGVALVMIKKRMKQSYKTK